MRLSVLVLCLLLAACSPKPSNPALEGHIAVSPELRDQVRPGDVLYVIAREPDGPPMPIAVKRIDNLDFPVPFILGPDDVMRPGTEFKGPFMLKARIDKDGDAGERPGDLVGTLSPVDAGQKDLEIIITEVVK